MSDTPRAPDPMAAGFSQGCGIGCGVIAALVGIPLLLLFMAIVCAGISTPDQPGKPPQPVQKK